MFDDNDPQNYILYFAIISRRPIGEIIRLVHL